MHTRAATPPEYASHLTSRGQVTIPAALRRKLGLRRGDPVAIMEAGGVITVRRAASVTDRTAGLLRGALPALSPEDERAAIEEAWAHEATGLGG